MINWSKLLKWYDYITASKEDFNLENRVFNIFSSFAIFFYLLGTIENLISGFDYRITLTTFSGAVGNIVCYYLCRFKNMHKQVIPYFILMSLMLCISGWIFNGGSLGPFSLITIFYLFIYIIITKNLWQFIVSGICFIVSMALYLIELKWPSLIIGYPSREMRLYDMIFSSTVVIALVFLFAKAIKDSYIKERLFNEEQNQLIRLQNEKLEQRNLLKTRLLSVLSHDLRSPLTSVITLIEAFNSDSVTEDEMKNFAMELQDRVRYNLSLLDNLVIWTRNQMYGFAVKIMEHNLAELADECVQIFKPIATRKNITINYNISSNIRVSGDGDMIKVIFRNLISNAIKFTDEGGVVSVAATEPGNGLVKISVSDNGVGIQPELLQSLFTNKIFTTRGTKSETGSGLGLMMCKDFVEQNGGEIAAESIPGKGTVITFTIPAA